MWGIAQPPDFRLVKYDNSPRYCFLKIVGVTCTGMLGIKGGLFSFMLVGRRASLLFLGLVGGATNYACFFLVG